MPETKLESALSAAADTFEAQLDKAIEGDIRSLCGNHQKPYVARQIKAMQGYMVLVQVSTEGDCDPS